MCVIVLISIVVSVIVVELCPVISEKGCEPQETASQSAKQHNVLTGLQKQLSCRPSVSLRLTAAPADPSLPGRLRRLRNSVQQLLKAPLVLISDKNHPAKRTLRKQN